MSKKESIKLKTVHAVELKENYNILVKYDVPIWRKNREGKPVIVPLDKLELYFGSKKIDELKLYIDEKWEKRIKNEIKITDSGGNMPVLTAPEMSDDFETSLKTYGKMNYNERNKLFDDTIIKLNELKENTTEVNSESIDVISVATKRACYINKVSLGENVDDSFDVPYLHLNQIADKTSMLVKTVTELLKENKTVSNYLNLLEEKSKGMTIDHMNNVFFKFVSFSNYYNNYFTKGGIVQLRSQFNKKFLKYYENLLPDLKKITLESVFSGGMRKITGEELQEYSMGALLHDIGKLSNIDYFESDSTYDRKVIVSHVPSSYNMIIKAKSFSGKIASLAALHHEYYNDSSGYGITKVLFKRKDSQRAHITNCISYNIDDLENGTVLGYFPAKVLEIVDVFVALRDKGRKYRDSEFSIVESLNVMQNEFIDNNLKLDPVLFTIFVSFVKDFADIDDVSMLDKTAI